MKRPVCVVDIDGVLADFLFEFTALASKIFGCPIRGTVKQKEWNNFEGLTEVQVGEVWEKVKESGSFWGTLPALLSYEEMKYLWALMKHADVYFATSRPGLCTKYQTERWLSDVYEIPNPTVLVTSKKGEACRVVGATHAVDDKAGNAVCIAYMSEAQAFLLNRPYNQFDQTVLGTKVTRIDSFSTFVEHALS